MPLFDTSHIRVPEREVEGLDITVSGRVEYRAKQVTHHVPRELPAVHFGFSADDSVASFSINFGWLLGAENGSCPRQAFDDKDRRPAGAGPSAG